MSKVIKQMQMDDVRKTFDGVRDMVFLQFDKLGSHGEYLIRKNLREKKVRLKCDMLKPVLAALSGMSKATCERMVSRVCEAIRDGEPKGIYLSRATFDEVCASLDAEEWAAPLKAELTSLRSRLITHSSD